MTSRIPRRWGRAPSSLSPALCRRTWFWRSSATYWGEKAYLDQVTFKIYEDANALMSALSAESVDMAFHLTIDQVNTVSGGAYKTLEGTMNLVQALYLNNDVEPFDNEKVRQAMCYAVNVEEILNLTGEGHGKKLGSSIYPAFTKYFDESLSDYYTYDVEKAKQLLKEAGYEDGFSMTITVPSNYTPHMNVAEVLWSSWPRWGSPPPSTRWNGRPGSRRPTWDGL